MWIIKCTGHHSRYEFIVGPFGGGDDEAVETTNELQASGTVDADVQMLIEPGRWRSNQVGGWREIRSSGDRSLPRRAVDQSDSQSILNVSTEGRAMFRFAKLDVVTVVLAVVIGSVVSSIVAMAPAYAGGAAGPCKTQGNYFDGYFDNIDNHPTSYFGTSAFITSTIVDTCTGDTSSPDPDNAAHGFTNATASWVMLVAADYRNYSQAGFVAGANQNVYVFAEFTNPSTGGFYNRFVPALGESPANTKYAFYEQYKANCAAPTNHACEESLVGNARITDTNYVPQTYWRKPWFPQYMGEKTYQASDIMGNTSNHLNFTGMGVQGSSTSGFSSVPCILSTADNYPDKYDAASRATHSAINCTAVDIWTTS